MSSLKESNSIKAKQHNGNESIQPESDISENELTKLKYKFLQNNIEITTSEILVIQNEKDTKSQVCSEKWKNERKKRQTASNFGNIFKRKPSIKVTPLVLQLLYSNFKGNKATRIGLREEQITIQEYINIKGKDNIEIKVEPCGLIIDKKFKYLAASPDGKVIDKENNEIGLIEIKNLVHDKNLTLTQAATSLKNFCLEKYGDENNIKKKTPSIKKKQGKRKDLTTDDEETQGPSHLNDHQENNKKQSIIGFSNKCIKSETTTGVMVD
ncbi:unnamed protein product [Mytilus edulis]|uniref:YqaJ viral recombinase domain-containing protein n=1 Tax=Mytilus edulis TaxID=6550 RepID=A0A8S3UXS4_MYTED|nr:unnamed protein product [Mytilus edulis]